MSLNLTVIILWVCTNDSTGLTHDVHTSYSNRFSTYPESNRLHLLSTLRNGGFLLMLLLITYSKKDINKELCKICQTVRGRGREVKEKSSRDHDF